MDGTKSFAINILTLSKFSRSKTSFKGYFQSAS